MNIYDITTIDPAPVMTLSRVQFTGTFAEAIKAAHASFEKSDRTTTIFSQGGSYAWYRISGYDGTITNNNRLPIS